MVVQFWIRLLATVGVVRKKVPSVRDYIAEMLRKIWIKVLFECEFFFPWNIFKNGRWSVFWDNAVLKVEYAGTHVRDMGDTRLIIGPCNG